MNHETESDSTRPQKRVNMGCLALVGVLILGMVLVGVSIFRLNSMVTRSPSLDKSIPPAVCCRQRYG